MVWGWKPKIDARGRGAKIRCFGGGRMLEGQPEMDAGEGIGNGCWRKDQKWMLEPEEDAPRDQGSSVKTDGED